MYRQTALAQIMPPPVPTISGWAQDVITQTLTDECQSEVLQFLAQRPLHTVSLVGIIRDNGLVSPFNRGSFYACRNRSGELEGVALIGHATLMETRTERALQAFAEIAQKCTTAHMIMGEQARIEEFWNYYSEDGQQMRRACREWLFELRCPIQVRESSRGLRLATPDDLDLILPVHAQMAFEESGVNPLKEDPVGFRGRCLRRIELGRTWVLIESGRLIFKGDIVSDTKSVVYLEGIWTAPEDRGKGHGLRCMSELGHLLLQRADSICILVNDQNIVAHEFYKRAGFKFRSVYDTIFLA